jgi:uncharacterized protein (TIGR02001 family)
MNVFGRVDLMNSSNVTIAAAVALVLSSVGHAQESSSPDHFTANAGLYSQYVFRGLTQTQKGPALQGGIDYVHDSGLYAGMWASNINWFSDLNPGNSASIEWDGYAGFKKTWLDEFTTDLGYLRYEYPGSYPALALGVLKPNTDEVYLGLGWKWVILKYSYAVSDLFGVPQSEGSSYLDLSVAVPLPQSFALTLHAGQQQFSGAGNDPLFGYEDYRAGLSYGFADGWTAAMNYTHTTAKDAGYTILGHNIGDDQLVIAMSRAF